MSTHSTDGRPWAKLSQLKPGDKLVADGGFICDNGHCIVEGAVLEVEADPAGYLFVPCSEGGHWLTGQLAEDNDSLVGFWCA